MFFTHDLVQIDPWRVDSLAPGILPAVEHIVQNLDSQMGHTNLIYLRKTHSEPNFYRIFVLHDRIDFVTNVAGRFLYIQ